MPGDNPLEHEQQSNENQPSENEATTNISESFLLSKLREIENTDWEDHEEVLRTNIEEILAFGTPAIKPLLNLYHDPEAANFQSWIASLLAKLGNAEVVPELILKLDNSLTKWETKENLRLFKQKALPDLLHFLQDQTLSNMLKAAIVEAIGDIFSEGKRYEPLQQKTRSNGTQLEQEYATAQTDPRGTGFEVEKTEAAKILQAVLAQLRPVFRYEERSDLELAFGQLQKNLTVMSNLMNSPGGLRPEIRELLLGMPLPSHDGKVESLISREDKAIFDEAAHLILDNETVGLPFDDALEKAGSLLATMSGIELSKEEKEQVIRQIIELKSSVASFPDFSSTYPLQQPENDQTQDQSQDTDINDEEFELETLSFDSEFIPLTKGVINPGGSQGQSGESELRVETVKALGKIASPQSFAIFMDLLQNDTDSTVRAAAARGLKELKDNRAREVLIKAAENTNPRIREEALNALAHLELFDETATTGKNTTQIQELRERIAQVISQGLEDSDNMVRLTISFNIHRLGTFMAPYVLQALKSENSTTRELAVGNLGKLLDRENDSGNASISTRKNRESSPSLNEQFVGEKETPKLTGKSAANDFDPLRSRVSKAEIIDNLLVFMDDPIPKIRQSAVRSVGSLILRGVWEPRLVTALKKRLEDEDGDVREATVRNITYFTFSEFKPSFDLEWIKRELAEPLISLYKKEIRLQKDLKAKYKNSRYSDEDSRKHMWAWKIVDAVEAAFGAFEISEAVPVLIEVIQDEVEIPSKRGNALKTLGRVGRGNDQAFQIALTFLNHSSREIWASAINALGHLGNPQAFEPLLEILRHNEKSIAWSTAEALGRLKDPRAFEILSDLLINKHPELDKGVKFGAATGLGELHDPRSFDILAQALAATKDTSLRWTIIQAFVTLGDLRARPILENLVETDFWTTTMPGYDSTISEQAREAIAELERNYQSI